VFFLDVVGDNVVLAVFCDNTAVEVKGTSFLWLKVEKTKNKNKQAGSKNTGLHIAPLFTGCERTPSNLTI
jgi:hypothetical protein